MEREKILEALECCKSKENQCKRCSYYKDETSPCFRQMLADALALIRELTEENDQKDETIAGLIGTIKDAYGFAVRKMQERLKESLVGFSDEFRYWAEGYIAKIAKEMLEEQE